MLDASPPAKHSWKRVYPVAVAACASVVPSGLRLALGLPVFFERNGASTDATRSREAGGDALMIIANSAEKSSRSALRSADANSSAGKCTASSLPQWIFKTPELKKVLILEFYSGLGAATAN